MAFYENDFHEWLVKNLPSTHKASVGIGDDAAVLEWLASQNCIVTSDMLADGVHFVLAEAGAERAGRKCLAVNLSDLAAMGAEPIAAVVSLMLPAHADESLPRSLLNGMLPLASEFETAIVGGDTNTWSGELVVSVTAIGTSGGYAAFRRDQAVAGDRLFVTGSLGGSLLGHHLDFTPQIATALALQERSVVRAAMDISDGLALDASRMAKQSKCGMEFRGSAIPVTQAAVKMSQAGSGKSPLEHAWGDGEDFELLIAVPPDLADSVRTDESLQLIEIGKCVAESGLWLIDDDGNRSALAPLGYQH